MGGAASKVRFLGRARRSLMNRALGAVRRHSAGGTARARRHGHICTEHLAPRRIVQRRLTRLADGSAVEIEGALKRRRQADKNSPHADATQAQTPA